MTEDFKVDFNQIHLNRKAGISGMMRVKNDAEFIEECINSCISALDELVIVYNGCTDDSPAVIKRIAEKYPEKIKVFHYTPKILSTALSEEEYKHVKLLPENSVELLANYYNFALSKTTYSHVVKIDADQIYFTDVFKGLCDRIRNSHLFKISFLDVFSFYRLARKLRYYDWQIGDSSNKGFKRYRKVLEYLCSKGILSVAISGINVFMNKEQVFVTNGLITGKLNILAQFNGTGDSLIFKVKKKTRFVPFDDPTYGKYTSCKYTYIEKLKGAPRGFSWGLLWWHLNSMRVNIYNEQVLNLNNYPQAFTPLEKFRGMTSKEIRANMNPEIVSDEMKTNYTFYWENCRNEIPFEQINHYDFSPSRGLTKNLTFKNPIR